MQTFTFHLSSDLSVLVAWLLSNRGRMTLVLLSMVVIAQLCGIVIGWIKITLHLNMDGLCMVNPPLRVYTLAWYRFHGRF
jgi:hypothetical protein